MAGRGRGGKSGSLTQEQLQALGCVGKDMPSVTLAPPPLFPPLLAKPVPLETSNDREYKILWKEDFYTYLKDSPYYLNRKNTKNENPRYSETIANALENETKRKQKSDFNWDYMPKELYPNFKRKRDKVASVDKKADNVNVQEKLKALEEKEKFDRDDDAPKDAAKRKTSKDGGDEEEKEEDEEELEEDEEMDDDNDYGNNYFDNGESFNDEDDNLDDGPTY